MGFVVWIAASVAARQDDFNGAISRNSNPQRELNQAHAPCILTCDMQPAVDLNWITGFQWDDGNARKSEERHGVTQAEAESVFADERLLFDRDIRHSQSEQRYNALGRSADGRLLHITFTLRNRDTIIRVISARDMNRRERNRYAQET